MYVLDKAFMVYKIQPSNERYSTSGGGYYFQEHRVHIDDNQEPHLLEGRPLTKEALVELCSQVVPSLMGKLVFLNGNVLATAGVKHGPDIWWTPPAVRPMFFAPAVKIPNRKVPWPGLVIAAYDGVLEVYVVKGNKRPDLNTRLFKAPFLNMGEGNAICLGNAAKPKRNNDYVLWERALLESAFSEDRGAQRVKKGTLTNFWRRIVSGKHKRFPYGSLLPCDKPSTLKELLQTLKNSQRSGRGT